MTQKNIFVFLFAFANLLCLSAMADSSVSAPDMSCAKFPKTFTAQSIVYTFKDISGNYTARVELNDLRAFPCLTQQDYIKEHDLFRFLKTQLPAHQSLGTITYQIAETGRVTQTEELDVVGLAFKNGKPSWIWGKEYDLNRYFYTTVKPDGTGLAFDKLDSLEQAPVSVPSVIIPKK